MTKLQNLIRISGNYVCSKQRTTSKGLLVQIDFDSECGISLWVSHEDFKHHLLFVGDIGVPQHDGKLNTYEEFLLAEDDEINEKLQEFFVLREVTPADEFEFEACSNKSEDMWDCAGFPEYANLDENKGHQRDFQEEDLPLKGLLDLDVDHLQNYYANA